MAMPMPMPNDDDYFNEIARNRQLRDKVEGPNDTLFELNYLLIIVHFN